ncbi:nucleoside monophosphate kinase [Candidatus Parcubacteria bacterium]|nr:nucleoside monophosphate kinase [Candidatus Parcubacteria bacterium]
MIPQTFVLIGRSGCGKGTQARLLNEYLQQKDAAIPIYYLETGKRFRDFIAQDGYTNTLARDIMKSGRRQPDFLAVWMWSHHFVEDLKGNEHLVIDGTPRSLSEAQVLDNAFTFYQRQQPKIVYINVSRDWSEKHLMARGRADDVTDDIKARLDWYDRDVQPAVDFFKQNNQYHFVDVNGEQPIVDVHKEIIEKIGL